MKKNSIAIAFLLTTSSFATQATTTIDLQDFTGTLIDNKWQDFSAIFGPTAARTHSSAPYSTATTDGLGSVTLSPIVNFDDNSHIHVSGGDGDPATATTPFIHGDVGGVFIDGSGSHDTFSFQSMDILHSALQADGAVTSVNSTITVRGFLGGVNNMLTGITEVDDLSTTDIDESTHLLYKGGNQVASAIINNGFEGNFNFLTADAGFAEVDYVEFFFTDFYRFKPSSMGEENLDFQFDNIVIGEAGVSAVPVPAAVWLFGTGLVGLVSLGKRKQKVLTA